MIESQSKERLVKNDEEEDSSSARISTMKQLLECLKDLRERSVPLIKLLRNPNYQSHHLAAIAKEAGIDLDYGLSLRKLLKRDESALREALERICSNAEKEWIIKERCGEMMKRWKEENGGLVVDQGEAKINMESLMATLEDLEKDKEWLETELLGDKDPEDSSSHVLMVDTKADIDAMLSVVRGWKALHEMDCVESIRSRRQHQMETIHEDAKHDSRMEGDIFGEARNSRTDGDVALSESARGACRWICQRLVKERRILYVISHDEDDEIYSLQEFFSIGA